MVAPSRSDDHFFRTGDRVRMHVAYNAKPVPTGPVPSAAGRLTAPIRSEPVGLLTILGIHDRLTFVAYPPHIPGSAIVRDEQNEWWYVPAGMLLPGGVVEAAEARS